MLNINLDAQGAVELAAKLEQLLQQQGFAVGSPVSRAVVAALMGFSTPSGLRAELDTWNVCSSGPAYVPPPYEVARATLAALAEAVLLPFHMDELFEVPGTVDASEPVPYFISPLPRAGRTVVMFRVPSAGDESEESRIGALASADPVELGVMFASAIAEELLDAPEVLEPLADLHIAFDKESGNNYIDNSEDSDCPYCAATHAFNEYAEKTGRTPVERVAQARACGHIVLFAPYAAEQLYALHRCDGVVRPLPWTAGLFDSQGADLASIEPGADVWLVEGLLGVVAAEFADVPCEGVVVRLGAEESGLMAYVRCGGQTHEVALELVIPKAVQAPQPARHLH